MMRALLFVFAIGFFATPAHALVTAQDAGGFSIKHEVRVAADPARAYRAFVRIGDWWNGDHTYSGQSRNLSIDLRPGGCWCERLEKGGFVRHMRVESAIPTKLLRFSGGLGPLQEMGVSGAMSVAFEASGDGGTKVTLTYAVNGRTSGDWAPLARAVDGVLAQQLSRFTEAAGA
jgi:uncharacterized protein YndB with AHSA1/START domain